MADGCRLCDLDHRRGSPECPAARIGKTIAGKYALTALIGVGGMGAVYRARHVRLGVDVAIKMIHAKFAASEDIARRFDDEAKRVAALRHAGIVQVADLGRDDDGCSYIEMELLSGEPVDRLLHGGPLPLDRALDITMQALDALEYAHARGVVHRDLKPENLFLVEGTQVKILDFGIAKAIENVQSLTETGSMMGTPTYMSPEQLTDAKNVDRRTDIYAMGATLFELVTGQRSVAGATLPEVISNVLRGIVSRTPSALRAQLPRWLDDIVQTALAPEPANRFASAAAMRRAIETGRAMAGPSLAADAVAETVAPSAPSILGPGQPRSAGEVASSATIGPGAATPAPADPAISKTVQSVPPAGTSDVLAEPERAQDSTATASAAAAVRSAAATSTADTAPPAPRPAAPTVPGARPARRVAPVLAAGAVAIAGGVVAVVMWPRDAAEHDVAPPADAAPADTPIDVAPPPPPVPEGMVRIAGATFERGSTREEVEDALAWCAKLAREPCPRELYERELPRHRVTVPAFFLDRTEVTNAAFAAALARADATVERSRYVVVDGRRVLDLHRAASGVRHERGAFAVAPGMAELPVVQVTWEGARWYCEDAGKRLPSESEWELAARGAERRAFPWGDDREVACDQVAFGRRAGLPCAASGDRPAAVATSPRDRTPEGVHDLAGNVSEWVLDLFAPYPATCEGACVEAAPPGTAAKRIARGGYYDGLAESLRVAGRSRFDHDSVQSNVGFRCAKEIP